MDTKISLELMAEITTALTPAFQKVHDAGVKVEQQSRDLSQKMATVYFEESQGELISPLIKTTRVIPIEIMGNKHVVYAIWSPPLEVEGAKESRLLIILTSVGYLAGIEIKTAEQTVCQLWPTTFTDKSWAEIADELDNHQIEVAYLEENTIVDRYRQLLLTL
jgi:hypothetical protein